MAGRDRPDLKFSSEVKDLMKDVGVEFRQRLSLSVVESKNDPKLGEYEAKLFYKSSNNRRTFDACRQP
jgi:hypothetical protein